MKQPRKNNGRFAHKRDGFWKIGEEITSALAPGFGVFMFVVIILMYMVK